MITYIMTTTQLDPYLDILIRKGLLKYEAKFYKTTEAGLAALPKINEVVELLSD